MKIIYTFFFFFLISTSRAQSSDSCNVQLAFEHMVGKELLELGRTYQNDFGEKFIPKSFKYYVSNIAFQDDSGKLYMATTDCFLIDELEPESKRIAVFIPPGKYTRLKFTLGIDSLRSSDDVHEGALDPYHGMFWTWNTGFVSAKLEGTSSASKMPQQMFQYDIGGFRAGQNSLRTIEISLDSSTKFQNKYNTLITVNGDVMKWFSGKHQLKIASNPFVHTPGELALLYADNYALMFSLKNIRKY